jgi:NAD(P)-dependent dehydrogenase (short-subunit alcohol dehydrogenase family)
MAKGGIVGLTRALALDLAPEVRVNAIAPGLTATAMVETIPGDVLGRMVAAIPLRRMARPEEMAAVVSFLCSEDASYLTGHVVVAGGGRSLS